MHGDGSHAFAFPFACPLLRPCLCLLQLSGACCPVVGQLPRVGPQRNLRLVVGCTQWVDHKHVPSIHAHGSIHRWPGLGRLGDLGLVHDTDGDGVGARGGRDSGGPKQEVGLERDASRRVERYAVSYARADAPLFLREWRKSGGDVGRSGACMGCIQKCGARESARMRGKRTRAAFPTALLLRAGSCSS